MAKTGVDIRGAKQVLKNMVAAGERGVRASGAALYLVGSDIITDAKRNTPVDLGPMRNSGYATLPTKRGRNLVVEIGFGGPAKEYVVRQHEDLNLTHEVGEAKFLERAINRKSASIVSDLERYATAAFKASAGATRGVNPTDPGGK